MRAWRGVGEENGKPGKKNSKLERRYFSMNLQSVRGTMRKERRKKKSEEKRKDRNISEGPMLFLNLG